MQANAFGFDGDAAFALQVHGIEHLRMHLALGERAGEFQQAVGQRGFAVVNVRNDAEIADVLGIHVSLCESAAPAGVLHALRAGDAPFKLSSLPHKGGKSKLERGNVRISAGLTSRKLTVES
jgi:hypothetical protein